MAGRKMPTVPCELCGVPTTMTATKRCDRCWELESRVLAAPDEARKILERAGKLHADVAPELESLHHQIFNVLDAHPEIPGDLCSSIASDATQRVRDHVEKPIPTACDLCGAEPDELNHRCDVTLGRVAALGRCVWLCDDCNGDGGDDVD